jgi:Mrp family chromosome partitioning ATPase
MNELKQRYDHIIIDTSPIGIISDALHLSKFAGNIFLIARHHYTPLELFKKVSESFQQKNFGNVFVIVNDIHKTNSHSYGYGYYYGKGYYYNKKNSNNRKPRLKKLFNKAIKKFVINN